MRSWLDRRRTRLLLEEVLGSASPVQFGSYDSLGVFRVFVEALRGSYQFAIAFCARSPAFIGPFESLAAPPPSVGRRGLRWTGAHARRRSC